MLSRSGVKRVLEMVSPRAELEAKLRDYLTTMSREQIDLVTRGIGQATRVVMAKLASMEKKMDAKLEALLGAVEAQQTKIDSLVALTTGLHQQVLDAMGATLTPSQKDRIDRIFAEVEQNSADIDAALTANTVAASAGAISDGPSAADIKGAIDQGSTADPGNTGSTDPSTSGS